MKYEAEFQFFLRLLKNLDIPVRIFRADEEPEDWQGMDIYMILNPNLSYDGIFEKIAALCRPSCIYRMQDEWFCTYLLFMLPQIPKPSYVIVGPYTKMNLSKEEILKNTERLSLPPSLHAQVEQFFDRLVLVQDPDYLTVLVNTLGAVMWGNLDAFIWKDLDVTDEIIFPVTAGELCFSEQEEPYIMTKLLEEQYQMESDFLQAVTQGQAHKAEMIMKNYTVTRLEHRLADPIRNIKNYSIILNTLLRKAVERGGVHPIHINKLSTMYAKQIELLTTTEGALRLHKEMVHKYCLLVKNYSLKSYSPLIKKVLTNIEADITADLSLKEQAELLNINASYLSSLFKKETGVTLTEYVNRSRITHAVTLLNTTNMQVQLIAQYCGISDVNYFTKLFKKYIGKTPQEYRRHISIS